MRYVNLCELKTHIKFVERASEHFDTNLGNSVYTDEDIEPGCLVALRWGLSNDHVLVLKLDENELPSVYQAHCVEEDKS